ncbi:MAG: hypothetical protein UT03_C0016G0001 [Candidatus Moranbacteria bacterium GW2011_GWD2_38_7]|nr:MAG: hypothetical protein UT03_C0016G0001 [Candidatus Moranbacteria bacterium GW2011_GWD2_38_7]
MKIKKIKVLAVALLFELVFSIANPIVVHADVWQNTDGDPGTPVLNGVVIKIEKQIGGGIFKVYDLTGHSSAIFDVNDVYAASGFTVDGGELAFTGNSSDFVWKGDNNLPVKTGYEMPTSNGQYFCFSDKRIPGFCNALRTSCGVTNPGDTCSVAIAKVYDEKMQDLLQAELDTKFTAAGLDKEKANEAIEECGGDLSCIDKVLIGLTNEPSYASGGATSSFNDPLSVSSLSDLINSNSSEFGAANAADNDWGNSQSKTPAPKVDVIFNSSATSTQANSTMKATAIPSFFNNASDPKELYFTWYLKRKDCGLTNSKEPGDVASCDLDDDDKITENDWKIAAAKIIVAKSFDKEDVDYDEFPQGMNSQSSAYTAIPEISKMKGETKTDIGWINGFLRKDNGELEDENSEDESVANCYVKAPKSGRIYEIRKVTHTFEDECPENYQRACVSNQKANCSVLNPLFSQTDKDAAALTVPPVEYNISQSITSEFDVCAVSSVKEDNSDVKCGIENNDALMNFKTSVSCGAGKYAICVKKGNDYSKEKLSSQNLELIDTTPKTLGVIVGITPGIENEEENTKKMCSAVAKADPINTGLFLKDTPIYSAANEDCKYLQSKSIAGLKDAEGSVIIEGNSNLQPKCQFERGANLCKHLFPNLPKDIKSNSGDQALVGDGEFNIAEKKFWGTDPSKPDTLGVGKDEERIVGLGIDSFEWMYSSGDQIGVAVEGEGITPTDHADSSYQRMWAFPNGKCDALDEMESSDSIDPEKPNKNTRGFYMDGAKGILTAEVDLDECLKDNLLNPAETGTSKMTVALSATPENPINDVNGDGDILNVSAFESGGLDNALYTWSIQKSKDGSIAPSDTTQWMDVTTAFEDAGSITEESKQGLNKNNFAINLNLKNSIINQNMNNSSYSGVFYIKVRVRIAGSAADGEQSAVGEVIVRVKTQENEIIAYPVTATNEGMLSLNKGLTGQSLALCKENKANCFVIKNQIIGLEVPLASKQLTNFSWKVNGNDISCGPNISSSCSAGGNKLFLPILGNEGESLIISASALDEKNESVEIRRNFIIGSTQLQIMTTDDPNSSCGLQCLNNNSVCRKYLGRYNYPNGATKEDCAEDVWETREGNNVTFVAGGQTGFDWTIDGQSIPEFRDKNQIPLTIDKPSGSSYNIGLITYPLPDSKIQTKNIQKALYKNWGVTSQEETEVNKSANMQLNVVDGVGQSMVSAKQTSFAASLITHLPQQFMFLLKIALTTLSILMITSLLFALMPETMFRQNE